MSAENNLTDIDFLEAMSWAWNQPDSLQQCVEAAKKLSNIKAREAAEEAWDASYELSCCENSMSYNMTANEPNIIPMDKETYLSTHHPLK